MGLDKKAEENLQKNHEFAEKNLTTLLECFPGKFVLINDQKIIDGYNTLKDLDHLVSAFTKLLKLTTIFFQTNVDYNFFMSLTLPK